MKVLGVIPARGGSTRIPRKNLETVGGVSLVVRAMRSAGRLIGDIFSDVVVSTDDVQIALTANANGCRRVVPRAVLGDGPMAPVLLEAHDWHQWRPFVAVCCVQPTSPLRSWQDIAGAVRMLWEAPDANSVVAIDESTGKRNGAVYVTRVAMLRDGLVFDDNSLTYPMPHERSLDINTPEDLELARWMWDERHLAE